MERREGKQQHLRVCSEESRHRSGLVPAGLGFVGAGLGGLVWLESPNPTPLFKALGTQCVQGHNGPVPALKNSRVSRKNKGIGQDALSASCRWNWRGEQIKGIASYGSDKLGANFQSGNPWESHTTSFPSWMWGHFLFLLPCYQGLISLPCFFLGMLPASLEQFSPWRSRGL